MFVGDSNSATKNEVKERTWFELATAGSPPKTDPTKESMACSRQPVRSTLLYARRLAWTKTMLLSLQSRQTICYCQLSLTFHSLAHWPTLPLKMGLFRTISIGATFSKDGTLRKTDLQDQCCSRQARRVFDASADTALQYKEAKQKQESASSGQSKSEVEAQEALAKHSSLWRSIQDELNKYRRTKYVCRIVYEREFST